jgi:hypothetical protein
MDNVYMKHKWILCSDLGLITNIDYYNMHMQVLQNLKKKSQIWNT